MADHTGSHEGENPRKAQIQADLKKLTTKRKRSAEASFLKGLVPALVKPKSRKPKLAPFPKSAIKGLIP